MKITTLESAEALKWVRILLKRSLFSHCNSFDLQVRIARFCLRIPQYGSIAHVFLCIFFSLPVLCHRRWVRLIWAGRPRIYLKRAFDNLVLPNFLKLSLTLSLPAENGKRLSQMHSGSWWIFQLQKHHQLSCTSRAQAQNTWGSMRKVSRIENFISELCSL